MKKIPYGIQDFEKLITNDYMYVDKTARIHNIISEGQIFFLSRPRRFGKSLLMSTLKAIFEGKKSLFKGLSIEKLRADWPVHPVIHLDMSGLDYNNAQTLNNSLMITLRDIGMLHKIDLSDYPAPGLRLKALVEKLSSINKVVILVDEYDKPILEHLNNKNIALECQEVLRSLYGKLKNLDAHLQLLFVTGVSKFSKTSIFSDLNQLKDLSEASIAGELLGYTEDEIKIHFPIQLGALAVKYGKSNSEIISQMRAWYNGYRFSKDDIILKIDPASGKILCKQPINKLYNPVSVNACLMDGLFQNYWFATGTPSHLIKLIKQGAYELKDVTSYETLPAGNSTFSSCELDAIPLDGLLYQAGYLTIKTYDIRKNIGTLGYPNFELRDSMASYLLSLQINKSEPTIAHHASQLRDAFDQKNIEQVSKIFESLFANIPYNLHIGQEAYYHSLIFMVLTMLGWDVRVEEFTSKGRTDLCVRFPNIIFLIEFKFNIPPKKALEQITTNRYFEKYLLEGKQIVLLGMSFNYKDKKLAVEHAEKAL